MRELAKTLVIAVSMLPSLVGEASAQQLMPSSVDVLVEDLAPGAERCNISKEGLEAATQSSLRYNKMGYSKEADTYVYVNANVMHIGGNSCVVALDVSIRQWDTLPDMRGGQISGSFEYCNAGKIQAGPDAANRLYASTKNAIDQCLAEVKPAPDAAMNRTLRQYLNDKASEKSAPAQ
jgi:hypothetical protein